MIIITATTITNLDKIPGLLELLTTTSTNPKDNKATIVEGTITTETITPIIGKATKDLDSTLITKHSSSTGIIKEISIRTIEIDLKTKEVIGVTFQVVRDRITIITGLTQTTTDKIDREMKEKRYLLRNTNKRWKADDFLYQI